MTGASAKGSREDGQECEQTRLKREAAEAAVAEIADGMAVGLGSGSTAAIMIDVLAQRVHDERLKIRAIPTSEASAEQARRLGIPLTSFDVDAQLDVAIDGADEVQRQSLTLIKGRGGALLREKIVASAAKRFIVIVDESKIVDDLGSRMPLPVEVIPWGWERVQNLLLRENGAESVMPRRCNDGSIYLTDNHNLILDCSFNVISDAAALAQKISSITGVVDHGLFIDMTSDVMVAGAKGLVRLEHRRRTA